MVGKNAGLLYFVFLARARDCHVHTMGAHVLCRFRGTPHARFVYTGGLLSCNFFHSGARCCLRLGAPESRGILIQEPCSAWAFFGSECVRTAFGTIRAFGPCRGAVPMRLLPPPPLPPACPLDISPNMHFFPKEDSLPCASNTHNAQISQLDASTETRANVA